MGIPVEPGSDMEEAYDDPVDIGDPPDTIPRPDKWGAGRYRDWLDELWDADNRRDPAQHAALLALERDLHELRARADYFRQQARQRDSKNRYWDARRSDRTPDSHTTEPDAVTDAASAAEQTKKITMHLLPLEREILELLADGFSRREIAEELLVPELTVKRFLKAFRRTVAD